MDERRNFLLYDGNKLMSLEQIHDRAAAYPKLVEALYGILEGVEASGGWKGDDELFNNGMALLRELGEL